jgi:UDP-N-acetylmuramate dehydrogenase
VVKYAVDRGLAGIECLSGILGFVGATPIQNVGAFGQEIGQTVTRVTVLDRHTQNRLILTREDCAFGYRDSRFKSHEPNRYIILNVEFELFRVVPQPARHGELAAYLNHQGVTNPSVQDIRSAVMALRRQKSLLIGPATDTLRSAGSFFVNPIVDAAVADALKKREGASFPLFPMADGRFKLAAAWLIEHAGWRRGQREGSVGLSSHHCLVLVAHERAESQDLVALAQRIRASVVEHFGIELRPEPSFWGFDELDRGLPVLEEDAPPTLGSASWPTSERSV